MEPNDHKDWLEYIAYALAVFMGAMFGRERWRGRKKAHPPIVLDPGPLLEAAMTMKRAKSQMELAVGKVQHASDNMNEKLTEYLRRVDDYHRRTGDLEEQGADHDARITGNETEIALLRTDSNKQWDALGGHGERISSIEGRLGRMQ